MKDLIRKYSGPFSGTLAQAIQRITGVLLLAYLFLHVRTVYALSEGPAAFDRAVAAFRSPVFKLLEIALLGVVILHALNGVRITLIDVGISQTRRSRLFWIGTVGVGAIIFLAGAIPIFISSVLGR
jgi:succinate dehydrogenase / fumarate reductase, cytochrome b subunit